MKHEVECCMLSRRPRFILLLLALLLAACDSAEEETNSSGGFPVQGEEGLLGLAFDPEYVQNRFVYVTYARRVGGEYEA